MLIFKLAKIGFYTRILNWIQSYLTDRRQKVRFNGKLSNQAKVTLGVPQGSHLGALLFNLYINDISLILNHLRILIYADDMKLYLEIKNKDDIDEFNNEIQVRVY